MEGIIDIRELSFSWRKHAPVDLALNALRVEKGERVFIEGPSGSGKSTLLSLLAGVTVPQSGELHVLGKRLDRFDNAQRDRFRADHIGYIFQLFNLIPYLSMVENVVLACQFSTIRRNKARQRSGTLAREALRLLEHLGMAQNDLLHRPVTMLSVGQQQRVAAARALMGAPELLIADEPTSSLDADLRETFIRLLFQECAAAGSTLVFVSHDATLEHLFDRTIRITDINTASHGSPQKA